MLVLILVECKVQQSQALYRITEKDVEQRKDHGNAAKERHCTVVPCDLAPRVQFYYFRLSVILAHEMIQLWAGDYSIAFI